MLITEERGNRTMSQVPNVWVQKKRNFVLLYFLQSGFSQSVLTLNSFSERKRTRFERLEGTMSLTISFSLIPNAKTGIKRDRLPESGRGLAKRVIIAVNPVSQQRVRSMQWVAFTYFTSHAYLFDRKVETIPSWQCSFIPFLVHNKSGTTVFHSAIREH